MRGKDEFKGNRSNFTRWLRIFEHRGENGYGVVATPLGELGLILIGYAMFGAALNPVKRVGLSWILKHQKIVVFKLIV